jgi:hypothetical protein
MIIFACRLLRTTATSNETINVQYGPVIAKIDDFRRMTVWEGERLSTHRFWPKDVGHAAAVLQPFSDDFGREWGEVVLSTALMIEIANLVAAGDQARDITTSALLSGLDL